MKTLGQNPYLMFLTVFLGAAIIASLPGCGENGKGNSKNPFEYEEKIKPLYDTKRMHFDAIPITLMNKIEPARIKPDPARKFIHKVIGGIPIVGDVIELPVDLLTAVIQFPFEDKMKLPTDGPWNDPRILPLVQSARITSAHLEIVPENERGEDYEKRRCWIFFRCGESLNFLDEMYVNLVFPDPKHPMIDKDGREVPGEAHFQVLSAKKSRNYDKNKETIQFEATNVDLIPLIKNPDYGNDFHVKLYAKGNAPKREVYIRGSITIEIILQIPQVY